MWKLKSPVNKSLDEEVSKRSSKVLKSLKKSFSFKPFSLDGRGLYMIMSWKQAFAYFTSTSIYSNDLKLTRFYFLICRDFFSDFFAKHQFIFRLKVIRYVINRDLEKCRNEASFMMHCKCIVTMVQCKHKRIIKLLILWLNVLATGEIELTTGEKINLLGFFCSYKKTPDLNYFFRHHLHFQDYFQVWKIKTFSRIYDSVRTLFFLRCMYSHFQWFLNVLR